MAYAIKAAIADAWAGTYAFDAAKTMYGGKRIAAGDTIFLFASENSGGRGLVARGVVLTATAVPMKPDRGRQTPRVSIRVQQTANARRPLGRAELRDFRDFDDGRPESELNFKFYRQATDKLVGVSAATAAFLETHF